MSRGDQTGAFTRLKFTNHSDCSGAQGMLEGGSGQGVSFDALNKNIRETNKQEQENIEEDDIRW